MIRDEAYGMGMAGRTSMDKIRKEIVRMRMIEYKVSAREDVSSDNLITLSEYMKGNWY